MVRQPWVSRVLLRTCVEEPSLLRVCCPSLVLAVVAFLGLAVVCDGCALPGVFGQGFGGRGDARFVVLVGVGGLDGGLCF